MKKILITVLCLIIICSCDDSGGSGSSDVGSESGGSRATPRDQIMITGVPLGAPECVSDADCFGDQLCNPNHNFCQNAPDAMCAASEECQSLGHCTSVGGSCRAVTINDCRQSSRCRDCRCTLSQGECIFTPQSSMDSSGTAAGTEAGTVAGTIAGIEYPDGPDCAQFNSMCEPGTFTDRDCETNSRCVENGLCRASDDGSTCVFYITDIYCTESAECGSSGLCRASDDGTQCVFYATYTYCRNSRACQDEGLCEPSVDGSECVFYATDEICARLDYGEVCRGYGLCIADYDGSRCLATDQSCAQSSVCRADYLCRASADGAECIFYATDHYCAESEECMTSNRCRADVYGSGCTYTHEGCGVRVP